MITITICVGSSCHLRGSGDVVSIFTKLIDERGLQDRVLLKASFCMDDCVNGVCVSVDEKKLRKVSRENAAEIFLREILPYIEEAQ